MKGFISRQIRVHFPNRVDFWTKVAVLAYLGHGRVKVDFDQSAVLVCRCHIFRSTRLMSLFDQGILYPAVPFAEYIYLVDPNI